MKWCGIGCWHCHVVVMSSFVACHSLSIALCVSVYYDAYSLLQRGAYNTYKSISSSRAIEFEQRSWFYLIIFGLLLSPLSSSYFIIYNSMHVLTYELRTMSACTKQTPKRPNYIMTKDYYELTRCGNALSCTVLWNCTWIIIIIIIRQWPYG